MSIIDQIDSRELFVRVIRRGKPTTVKDQDKLAAELIGLAREGQRMQQEVENCNSKILVCYAETCPGRNYCRAYKEKMVCKYERS